MHVGGGKRGEDHQDLSYQRCYSTKDIIKHEIFDRFWGLIDQIDLDVEAYSGQTIYAFNKLTELSFEKGKPHNPSLVTGVKAMLTIVEYAKNPQVDIPTAIYQIGILLKKSKLLTTEHTDQQLLEKVASANRDREAN